MLLMLSIQPKISLTINYGECISKEEDLAGLVYASNWAILSSLIIYISVCGTREWSLFVLIGILMGQRTHRQTSLLIIKKKIIFLNSNEEEGRQYQA